MITKQDVWVVVSLLIISVIGAYLSKGIKENAFPWYTNLISAFLSYTVWTLMVKYYQRPLLFSSMIYDVATTVFWVMTLMMLGEKCSPVNLLGVAITIIGMAMVSL